ncbi:zinc ribbon domain-containing protein [Plantactinospora mayteni]|uniref:zinc ribbon domain-containing protein n=1 Tax=Plantactinospora mayteni TaxID=566021 RepID=UPI001944503F
MADRSPHPYPPRQGPLAGIRVDLVDERGTSSTCPACTRRISKPRGRNLSCPHCEYRGHRDLVAAAIIATRTPGGGPTTPPAAATAVPVVSGGVVTHRRAGRHLPGAGQSRRDPRRPPQHPGRRADRLANGGPPHQPHGGESLAQQARIHKTTGRPGELWWTPH